MNNLIKKNMDLLPALMREVEDKIIEVRGQKALLDFHVAGLYGVETKRVNEAVRNNPRKFPEGYVFELNKEESAALRSKISTIEVSPLTIEQVNGKGRHMTRTIFKVRQKSRPSLLPRSLNKTGCITLRNSLNYMVKQAESRGKTAFWVAI